MISGLIFDLDGTLVDSSAANVKAYAAAFKETGVDFDSDKYISLFGLRYPEIMEKLAPGLDNASKDRIKKLKAKYYKANTHLMRLNEGLVELLRVSRRKYKTALVSTANPDNIDSIFKHFFPNEDLFDIVITGQDVKHSKPHPECYQLALVKLNLKPHQCLAFEDSDIGIRAAIGAGIKTIKVAM